MKPYKVKADEPGMAHVVERGTGVEAGYVIRTRVGWDAHPPYRGDPLVTLGHFVGRNAAVDAVWASHNADSGSPS